MTHPPISRFPVPELPNLPQDIRDTIVAVQEKAGFVPNVFLAFAHRPDEFRAFFAYHEALMEKEGALTKAEREMIVVATSGANNCHYCVVAHGAILRIRAKNALVADQVEAGLRIVRADLAQAETYEGPPCDTPLVVIIGPERFVPYQSRPTIRLPEA